NGQDPDIVIRTEEERRHVSGKPTGNIVLHIENLQQEKEYTILVGDNAYKTGEIQKKIKPKESASIVLNLEKNYGWYDISIRIAGNETFEQRYAGHVETGEDTFTDPYMGRMV